MPIVKKDITGFIKEVNVIRVNCQIKDPNDIKQEDYTLLWNINKLICKLKKEEGLKCKG